MRRKPNPDQRRRELCDAAIELLAVEGVKGVSHLKVDRKARVPDGTTSFYFRTRSALLHAVAARVAELDLADLEAATKPRAASNGPSGLARLVMRSATGARLGRTKARHALALQGANDPVLDEALKTYSERFSGLIGDAVQTLQPDGTPDADLAEMQAYALTMFLSGILLGYVTGDRRIRSAEQLDRLMAGIIVGVANVSR